MGDSPSNLSMKSLFENLSEMVPKLMRKGRQEATRLLPQHAVWFQGRALLPGRFHIVRSASLPPLEEQSASQSCADHDLATKESKVRGKVREGSGRSDTEGAEGEESILERHKLPKLIEEQSE